MVHDMRAEAMAYLSLDDTGPIDRIGDSRAPAAGVAKTSDIPWAWQEEGIGRSGWLASQLDRLTPFTAQLEKGEWDWVVGTDGEGVNDRDWYEMASSDED